jgi:enoyl-CoA hydratase/carnithine racemase
MLLSGKEADADMAYRWGLVHKVAPAASTESAALTLAEQVAANPPDAVARLKAMLHEWDGVVERSRMEGQGQVDWARTHTIE